MRFLLCTVCFLAVVLSGCASKGAQLVGTWRAKPVEQKSSPNLGDVAASSMLGLATQNMMIEFTKTDEFKISQALGSATGSYKIEGQKVRMTLNTLSPNRELVLEFQPDGTLALERKFDSDPTVFFEKVK